ncbi:MAG TPA: STAS domain-containing protein [Spirochaetota bacterium]|nr:STAS domain-containing protein [Spirochaetota bacterium]HPC41237.1 STAS domain-containing protein [Spirochaetota bacterium]HPL15724.1 STAS domain-containing protein [Spirochaetota bacterium]HQF08151.1 STAS domain-containing protein [Spirochaetota bacterium]HQH96962.1 STAS domain-containing protein [Spirochaetota bacterium]
MISIAVNGAVTITIAMKLLTIHNSTELLKLLLEAAHQYDKEMVLDFINVSSLDSTVIAMLVEFNNYMNENKKKLTLVNLSPFIKKTFEILHITKFFNIK